MARPKGSINGPRERMLRMIEDYWPGFHPVLMQIEQAKIVYEEYAARTALCEAAARGEEIEGEPQPVTPEERQLLQTMFDRPCRYLVPSLKASEVKVDAAGGGLHVTIVKPDKA